MVRKAYKMIRTNDGEKPRPANQRETVNIRAALEEMGVARCPLCRAMLIARMGRRGPGFFCRCSKKRAA